MNLSQSPPKPAMAKRLWHVLRAVYYMLHKGVSKHKLTAGPNPRLARERTKLPSFSCCLCVDHTKSFYSPREVEFSCSNTPFYAIPKRKKKKTYHYISAKAVARALESLNNFGDGSSFSCAATPSPGQLRITDSPFPMTEEEEEVGEVGSYVDKEAEDFIRRFYQQLRSQQDPLLGRAC